MITLELRYGHCQMQIMQCAICDGHMDDADSHRPNCPHNGGRIIEMAAELASFGFNVKLAHGQISIAGQTIDPVRAHMALQVLNGEKTEESNKG